MSRAQLVDNGEEEGESLPSDSPVEDSESDDRSQATQEDESDVAEPGPRQNSQPDVGQTMNQARQEDQKKGLAVSRQLVRHMSILSAKTNKSISCSDLQVIMGDAP